MGRKSLPGGREEAKYEVFCHQPHLSRVISAAGNHCITGIVIVIQQFMLRVTVILRQVETTPLSRQAVKPTRNMISHASKKCQRDTHTIVQEMNCVVHAVLFIVQ